MAGEYQAERLDHIRKEIEDIESGASPRWCLLDGSDLLAYWREQERLGECYCCGQDVDSPE